MATSLHQQLKLLYATDVEHHEVVVGDYRIDAVDSQQRLVEIQCASLGAIRTKVKRLLRDHDVIVVKPLASRKQIVRKDSADGNVVGARYSPTRQTLASVFLDLVHFATVFPHPRLRLDVVMTLQREIRLPPTSRSSWKKKYSIHDRELVDVEHHYKFENAGDIWKALNVDLPKTFTTSELADAISVPRWLAQKAAYCFREMGLLQLDSKVGNALVYRISPAFCSLAVSKPVGATGKTRSAAKKRRIA